MKKKVIFTTILMAMSIIAFAQNNYYWSAGKKIYLKENPDVFIVKFSDTTKDIGQSVQNLRNKKEIRYMTPIKNSLGIIIAGGVLR
jgi:hypothetical protein